MGLLTVAETAARLRVSDSTVYQLAKTGALPACRVGRRVVIDEDGLTAFLARNTTQPVTVTETVFVRRTRGVRSYAS
jgi:excisionase family DNA binding protein